MTNPSKAKGTGGETELLRSLQDVIPDLVRTPAASIIDLAAPGIELIPWEFLATRPDKGRWLISMDLEAFKDLWTEAGLITRRKSAVYIEVKRYKHFSLHSIWEKKFGRS